MKAFTAALTLHALFGMACLQRAIYRGEWVQSACAFLVASSGIYLAVGMFRALRRAGVQFERRENAERRRREFREVAKAEYGLGAGPNPAKPPAARPDADKGRLGTSS